MEKHEEKLRTEEHHTQEINRRMSYYDELEGEWIDEEGIYAKEDITQNDR